MSCIAFFSSLLLSMVAIATAYKNYPLPPPSPPAYRPPSTPAGSGWAVPPAPKHSHDYIYKKQQWDNQQKIIQQEKMQQQMLMMQILNQNGDNSGSNIHLLQMIMSGKANNMHPLLLQQLLASNNDDSSTSSANPMLLQMLLTGQIDPKIYQLLSGGSGSTSSPNSMLNYYLTLMGNGKHFNPLFLSHLINAQCTNEYFPCTQPNNNKKEICGLGGSAVDANPLGVFKPCCTCKD